MRDWLFKYGQGCVLPMFFDIESYKAVNGIVLKNETCRKFAGHAHRVFHLVNRRYQRGNDNLISSTSFITLLPAAQTTISNHNDHIALNSAAKHSQKTLKPTSTPYLS
jgi:hypothetical protein